MALHPFLEELVQRNLQDPPYLEELIKTKHPLRHLHRVPNRPLVKAPLVSLLPTRRASSGVAPNLKCNSPCPGLILRLDNPRILIQVGVSLIRVNQNCRHLSVAAPFRTKDHRCLVGRWQTRHQRIVHLAEDPVPLKRQPIRFLARPSRNLLLALEIRAHSQTLPLLFQVDLLEELLHPIHSYPKVPTPQMLEVYLLQSGVEVGQPAFLAKSYLK
eukprot:TCALIF_00316-PA protein Name:"Protein of unknown function" AED:0.75 eAED:1.00 QI:0/0/0/0.5/1/1/2/0/214